MEGEPASKLVHIFRGLVCPWLDKVRWFFCASFCQSENHMQEADAIIFVVDSNDQALGAYFFSSDIFRASTFIQSKGAKSAKEIFVAGIQRYSTPESSHVAS